MFDPGNRLIAALDVTTGDEASRLIERLGGVPSWVKIGLELFCSAGPDIVRQAVGGGCRVMLDLKLHDIPQTVERAIRQIAPLGAELLTVHAAGAEAMLRAAVDAAGTTRVLAVTVLTSLDAADLHAIGAQGPLEELVVRRAQLALACGCAGVVASPQEIAVLRKALGPAALIVTPGVRPTGAAVGDQKRVATPAQARRDGADLLVVGRPLRDAPDPAAAARAFIDDIVSGGA